MVLQTKHSDNMKEKSKNNLSELKDNGFPWKKPSQKRIMRYWSGGKPVVSISCLTYNHAEYIEQCLQGFLMQDTTFPFEIIIHDDASTDGTSDIIRQYEAEYPQIIKPIYEVTNQRADENADIQIRMYDQMNGKYIAFCEGDDYWCDIHKLQKQFDFLENNETYFAVGHFTRVDCGPEVNKESFIYVKAGEYGVRELNKRRLFSHFSSYFVRNFSKLMSRKDLQKYIDIKCPGDRKFPFLFLQYGKLYVLPFWGSVYRFQSGVQCFTMSMDYDNRLFLWKECNEVAKYAASTGIKFDSRRREQEILTCLLIDYFTGKNRGNYEKVKRIRSSTLFRDMNTCKWFYLRYCFRYLKMYCKRKLV